MKLQSLDELKKLQEKLKKSRSATGRIIAICGGTGCRASNSQDVKKAFQEELKNRNLESEIEIKETGCHGLCEKGPIVIIRPEDIFYQTVQAKHVPEIVEKTLIGGEKVESILYRDLKTKERILHEMDIPFYKNQKRIVFGNNGHIDPTSIEDYLGVGGYAALGKALYSMKPQDIVEEIKASGLRGRGGGGFPAGRKWQSCIDAPSEDGTRYVICNADEGDPGAFMDRSVLEGNPHIVIEGMIIGAIAVGATQGFVYVRAEYPLAVEHLTLALNQAEEYGLLGDNILGSDHSFRIKIVRGAGAFVCGESTALMASIEGKVGRPRAKYVHTVEKGLYEKPTVLNNVETWANVPYIINNGSEWYNTIGTEGSKGTKIFALVGKINNTGLVEVPMGITLKEIIYDIGGGIPKGKQFKAVQTGGPSGGCIPNSMLDLPVDYDELSKVGSMMGSGGMIVMDEDTCIVDVARYFTNFLKGESCGKCVACREGVKRMWEILERICKGQGIEEDIDVLEEIGEYLTDSALCALGSTAANPVLTTLKYFKDEYLQHINEKYCPAGVCKDLFQFEIDPEACTGCGACLKKCPVDAIAGEKKEPHTIDQELCIKCGECYATCRFDAIKKAKVKEVVS
jgi:NADH:ubiquinone oxidoreductase subunit F (NADH-binding)/(2Fe-2S) ferredoxin/Pyruvate/2-oxoacid:ferredoxin oxidoreductase delta subunit